MDYSDDDDDDDDPGINCTKSLFWCARYTASKINGQCEAKIRFGYKSLDEMEGEFKKAANK